MAKRPDLVGIENSSCGNVGFYSRQQTAPAAGEKQRRILRNMLRIEMKSIKTPKKPDTQTMAFYLENPELQGRFIIIIIRNLYSARMPLGG